MKEEIQKFLVQDAIDNSKFQANLEIMKSETKEIYRAQTLLLNQKDISSNATETIEWMASSFNQPMAYPTWFMAAYPDVVRNISDLDDVQLIAIIGESTEDFINEDNNFKLPILRKLVDWYKIRHGLECAEIK